MLINFLFSFCHLDVSFLRRSNSNSTTISSLVSRGVMLVLSVLAFFVGPRRTYVVFEAASGVMGVVVLMQVVPRLVRGTRRRTAAGR